MKKIFLIKTILVLLSIQLFSQTDREFWFVVPEVSYAHSSSIGEPTYLHLTTLDAPSDIVISMPTNSAFTETRFTMEANSTQLIDLTWYIRDGYGTDPFSILEQVPDIGLPNEENILESGLPTTAGLVENKGIHLVSTGLITAYLERNNRNNCDIWSLKGENAKGNDFYVPGQNWMMNKVLNPTAYNSIDIVATEDGLVYFNPTAEVMNFGLAGSTYSVFLEKGQSICLRAAGIAIDDHLGGTHIWSDKPIVVSWKDDSVSGDYQCYDLMGDQIIPTDLAGDEYVVVRGNLSTAHEFVYIMSLEDGTEIICTKPDGTILDPIILGASGSIERVLLNNDYFSDPAPAPANSIEALHLQSSNGAPFIVYHVTGFGCESGASLLPPVNGCTGSTQVTFQRSTSESFFLNLFCKEAQINDFSITINNVEYPIPSSWFSEIQASGSDTDSDWWYLSKTYNEFTDANGAIPAIPIGLPIKVINTSGLFHLGLINGGATTGCRYGYLSNFSTNMGSANIGEFGTDYIKFCYGDTLKLQADGGISYAWENTNAPLVDGTFLDSKTSSSPRVNPPPGFLTYQVDITRACYFGGMSQDTSIVVSAYGYPEIKAMFDTVNMSTDNCSPFEMEYKNTSIGANKYEWTFERLTDTLTDQTSDPNPVFYSNTSQSVSNFKAHLAVSYSYNCPDTISKFIPVYPLIQAGATEGSVIKSKNEVTQTYTIDTVGAGPLTHIYWNWGDGQDSSLQISDLEAPFEFTHTFTNNTITDTNYYVSLVFIDSICNCRDTLDAPFMDAVFVPGYVQAGFVISGVEGCSPLSATFTNTTIGNVSYEWWINESADYSGAPNRTDNFESISQVFLNTDLTPKNYYIKLRVTHNSADGSSYTDTYGPDTLTVYPEFESTIVTTDPLEGCNELNVDFSQVTVPSLPNIQYVWDFGDGSTSAYSDPSVKTFLNNSLDEKNFEVALISTSEYGCSSATSVNIKLYHTEINLVENLGILPCKNDSIGSIAIEVNGGVSPYSFIWDDGEATQNRTQLKAGEYNVTVTDKNGCVVSETYSIIEPDSVFKVLGVVEDVQCKDASTGNVILSTSGNVDPVGYEWSNNSNEKNLNNVGAGNYFVTVTNGSGCSVIDSFNISEPDSNLFISGVTTDIVCKNDSVGIISIEVSGGIAPYSYLWADGEAIQNRMQLRAGEYSVTISDLNGCVNTQSYNITEPDSVFDLIGLVENVNCKGNSSGNIILSTSGTVNPIKFVWSNNSIEKNLNNVIAGDYSVIVTNGSGCSIKDSFNISEPDSSIFISGITTDINCKGDSTGDISISVFGGMQPYAYVWSNSDTSQNLSSLTSGNYELIVSDYGGCNARASFEITEPASHITIEAAISDVKCWGGNTGAIDLTVSGGKVPYQYVWSNGRESEDLNNLIVGDYGVVITDSNSCEESKEFTIAQPIDSISVSGTVTDAHCNDNSSGKIVLSVHGGSQPYTYLWNNGSVVRDLENISEGNYNVNVWDANQCEAILNKTVSQQAKAKLMGSAFYSRGTIEANNATVYLINETAHPNYIVQQVRIAAGGRFGFEEVPEGDYLVYVKLDNHVWQNYMGVMNSYYNKTFVWHWAENISLSCGDSIFIDLEMFEIPSIMNGSGQCNLKGSIVYNYGSNKSAIAPAPNVSIILFDEIAQKPHFKIMTDDNGEYIFDSIVEGSYSLIVDIPGITQISTHDIVIAEDSDEFENLDFEVDMVDFVINKSSGIVAIESQSELRTVKIYPNPTKNILYVSIDPEIHNDVQIKIFSLTGKLVRVIDYSSINNNDQGQIDISGLSAGNYILEIKGEQVLQTEKITIIN